VTSIDGPIEIEDFNVCRPGQCTCPDGSIVQAPKDGGGPGNRGPGNGGPGNDGPGNGGPGNGGSPGSGGPGNGGPGNGGTAGGNIPPFIMKALQVRMIRIGIT
jgi:hypothetical protein